MAPTVWLITGSTSGIGAALIDCIAARGDKVIASGRRVEERIGHLKSDSIALLELDIAAGKSAIKTQIEKAWNIFGHIDVLVNNAGMSAINSVEQADDTYIANMFQVNLFGQMHVTQAILPFFRAQGHGTITFTSSSSGWMALPFMSHYSMTKAALSTFAESLHKEISPLGLRAVAFDLGGYPTHLMQPRNDTPQPEESATIDAYEPLLGELVSMFSIDPMDLMPGDPAKCASVMVDIVKGEGVAVGRKWAVRVVLGSDSLDYANARRRQEVELLERWEDVSVTTDRGEWGIVKNLP
ncbi:hypothetical protein BJY04DRAFT_228150 [Aspergillus karnatakaensis]|uniref:SDR family oxidoreductase n=1 Tax=Aspergillus karnatakaensis TaxID=1810916 RepID=UPI003CCD7551